MRHALSVAILLSFVGGCKKPSPKVTPPTVAAPTASGDAVPVVGNTNYEAGAGAAQNARNAALRTITLAEMTSLGLFIEIEYNNNSFKMPDLNSVTKILKDESPQIAKAVADGKIVLCWTAEHKGIWAYEVGADTKGGVILVTGSARRAEADEVRKLLGR